jgi:hypothetical protein
LAGIISHALTLETLTLPPAANIATPKLSSAGKRVDRSPAGCRVDFTIDRSTNTRSGRATVSQFEWGLFQHSAAVDTASLSQTQALFSAS